ncbi:acyltransferase family protein [uncultured Vagococcus sp.]|uniref:acyltransferase family protein n=1 Tax=uncultured Vagococcus sp. TaxID=189676 RepID=UPI0028D34FE8|nr:acyltransferase family protein [uncultured Vagococcus sp.]
MFKLSKSSSVFLDIVRAFFSQMVLIGHSMSFLGLQQRFTDRHVPQIQSISVTVLFLLSGFLTIYSANNKRVGNKNYAFKDYFKNRFVRFYTVLIPGLVIIAIIDSLNVYFFREKFTYFTSFNLRTFISNLLMLQDFPRFKAISLFSTTSFGSARPLWTLPIEWFLYLAFGFFFFKLFNIKGIFKKTLILLIFSFIFIVPYDNFIFGRGNGLTFTWFLGVIVFYLLKKQIPLTRQTSLITFVTVGIFACLRIQAIRETFNIDYDPLFSMLCAGCLFFGIRLFTTINWHTLAIQASSVFSKFSFSLYITHYSLLLLINNWLVSKLNVYLILIIEIIVCNLIAYFFATLFENKLPKKIMAINLQTNKKTTTEPTRQTTP